MLVGLNGPADHHHGPSWRRFSATERGPHPYLVPADVYRPAAIQQLETARPQARRAESHPSVAGGASDRDRARRRRGSAAARPDTILIDTAVARRRRAASDELARWSGAVEPRHVILVATR